MTTAKEKSIRINPRRKSLRDLKRAEAEHYARPAVSIDIDVDSHNAKRGSKTRVNPASPDSIAAHELALYAENNGDLYRQRIDPIIKNLKRKQVKGIYDPALALKLWKYAADDAAKRYSREFGGNFSVATRKLAASELAEYYEEFLKNPLKGEKHIALQEKRGGSWFTIAWFPHTQKALAIKLGKQVHRRYPHKELRVFA